MSDQAAQLERVKGRLGSTVLSFCLANVGQEFYAAELREFVMARVAQAAPASPDRILRELRLRGHLDYEIVERRKSLYRVIRVGSPAFTGRLF